MDSELAALIERLSPEQQKLLGENPAALYDAANNVSWFSSADSTRLVLQRTPGLVKRCCEEGGYHYSGDIYRWCERVGLPFIGREDGTTSSVRYVWFPGRAPPMGGGWIRHGQVVAMMQAMRLDEPDFAEALLLPSQLRELGRGVQLVSYFAGGRYAYVVFEDEMPGIDNEPLPVSLVRHHRIVAGLGAFPEGTLFVGIDRS